MDSAKQPPREQEHSGAAPKCKSHICCVPTGLFGFWSLLQGAGGKDEGQEGVTLSADLRSLLQGLFFYEAFSLVAASSNSISAQVPPSSSTCCMHLEGKQQGKLCRAAQTDLNLGQEVIKILTALSRTIFKSIRTRIRWKNSSLAT